MIDQKAKYYFSKSVNFYLRTKKFKENKEIRDISSEKGVLSSFSIKAKKENSNNQTLTLKKGFKRIIFQYYFN